MHKLVVLSTLIVMSTSAAARADDLVLKGGTAFPGSFWMTAGDVGPAERGNEVVQGAFEQGITVWSKDAWFLVPFVSASFTADSEGYDWNNKRPVTAGTKLVRRVPGGVVQVSAGVNFERTPGTDHTRHVTGAASYWAGWKGSAYAGRGRAFRAFPGHVYATSGTLTGRDPENWISIASAQQGMVVFQSRLFAVVPYGAAAVSKDSKGRVWENRATYDAGVKVVRPFIGGVIEAGAAQRRQHQWRSNTSATAPVVYVNLWLGWNPRTLSVN